MTPSDLHPAILALVLAAVGLWPTALAMTLWTTLAETKAAKTKLSLTIVKNPR